MCSGGGFAACARGSLGGGERARRGRVCARNPRRRRRGRRPGRQETQEEKARGRSEVKAESWRAVRREAARVSNGEPPSLYEAETGTAQETPSTLAAARQPKCLVGVVKAPLRSGFAPPRLLHCRWSSNNWVFGNAVFFSKKNAGPPRKPTNSEFCAAAAPARAVRPHHHKPRVRGADERPGLGE